MRSTVEIHESGRHLSPRAKCTLCYPDPEARRQALRDLVARNRAEAKRTAEWVRQREYAHAALVVDYAHEDALRENRERGRLTVVNLNAIRAWRAAEAAAGRPSGLLDYWRAHGTCPTCLGRGWTSHGDCSPCRGTGRS